MWLSVVHVLDAQAMKEICNCCIVTMNKKLFIFLSLIRDVYEKLVPHTAHVTMLLRISRLQNCKTFLSAHSITNSSLPAYTIATAPCLRTL
jgi:hypothetical protein